MKRFHAEWLRFRMRHDETLILAPRGHGKSTILTVAYGLWRAVQNPDRRILIVSATAAQARAFLREIKMHVEGNPRFIRAFGELAGEKWTENEIILKSRRRIAKEATVTALGVGGPVIGRHYDIVMLDDVVDEDGASSEHMREKLFTWYRKVLLPCREPRGELHLVGTRYHPRDLYGALIESARSIAVFPEETPPPNEDASRKRDR